MTYVINFVQYVKDLKNKIACLAITSKLLYLLHRVSLLEIALAKLDITMIQIKILVCHAILIAKIALDLTMINAYLANPGQYTIQAQFV